MLANDFGRTALSPGEVSDSISDWLGKKILIFCALRGLLRKSMWIQKKILLPEFPRGCHLVTQAIVREMPELKDIRIGMLHLFLQHTSASLAINENADPDVRVDMETALNRVVPENQRFVHTIEGPDDMPAHVKSALVGVSLSVPISNGELAFGTWQGVYLCEHRNHGGRRSIVATLHGTL